MPSRTKITIDHDEIRRWAEQRGGHPATVKRTRGKPGDPGILRIDFPGFTGAQSLEQISWEEFFTKFDEQKLAFLYQETTARGLRSNFNKIIKRPAQTGQQRGARNTARASADGGQRTNAGTSSKAKSGRKRAGAAPKAKRAGKKGGRRKTAR
jgi:hypothetical protein